METLAASSPLRAPVRLHRPEALMMFGPYPAVIRDWHDGDTCHLDLDLGFGVQLTTPVSARIFGINAPELSTDEGKVAHTFAEGLCPPTTKVMVVSHGWDKYGGRFDATITLPDGKDFATEMLAANMAKVMKV